ncbi:MAG: type II toxin-antitoxin system RelE/ParE family toxin [Candidatus Omnitrophica bacterium]|nr:type II toxin-antitoxin system RelE/ParE family toxin [Candidatus Omnitrophota bacterium]
MIKNFGSKATEDLYHGFDSKEARTIPKTIWKVAVRKLDMLNTAAELKDLASPPANRLEKLRGSLTSYHSIRINDQYRIVFRFESGNAFDVKIIDYH